MRTSPKTRRNRLAVIGAGRAGGALAVLLARRGWKISAIGSSRIGRGRALARRCGAPLATTDPVRAARAADAVLIAVPDRAVSGIAARLHDLPAVRRRSEGSPATSAKVLRLLPVASRTARISGVRSSSARMVHASAARGAGTGGGDRAEPRAGAGIGRGVRAEPRVGTSRGPRDGTGPAGARIALHTSGAFGAELLDSLRPAGWAVGSFHPLIAFPPLHAFPPRRGGLSDLEGASIAIDGDAAARSLAREMARTLGACALELPSSERVGYHLAACFASNYVVTLASEAVELLAGAGLPRKMALAALLPLMRSTLGNLEHTGLPDALTGPVARGDDVTIARHAALLRAGNRPLCELHRFLVIRTARIARSAGWLDAAAVRRIDRALAQSRR